MDRIQYTYTFGMDDDEIERILKRRDTGVLAIAADGNAYAIPIAHHYQDGRLFVRLATHPGSEKMDYMDATETASYTLYDVGPPEDSWSVVVTGPLRELTGDERAAFDATEVNESFLRLRVFDEDVEAVSLDLYELEIETLSGRKTGTQGESN